MLEVLSILCLSPGLEGFCVSYLGLVGIPMGLARVLDLFQCFKDHNHIIESYLIYFFDILLGSCGIM